MKQLVIIGGGASGLMAAIAAKETDGRLDVSLLEGRDRVGKKLLATGNGRCNLTNLGPLEGRYHGDWNWIRQVLEQFTVEQTLSFFHSIGVSAVELEEGKAYPRSLQAASVLDALRYRAQELGVQTICTRQVTEIRRNGQGFSLLCKDGVSVPASAVIVCAGGKASASLSSDGAGYPLLSALGHSVTPLFPAIVQLRTDTSLLRPLKGIKVTARVTARAGGDSRCETGEVLFTEYGLSGPPVLQVSRLFSAGQSGRILLDLIPDWTDQELLRELKQRRTALSRRPLEQYLVGLLPKRLGETLLKAAGMVPLQRPVSAITERETRALAGWIKRWELAVKGPHSWQSAQVTAGGVRTAEFDPSTLESSKVRGLFAAGEVLDVDGDCGGFNLQWAWSSGRVAGVSAARCLKTADKPRMHR